MTTLLAAPAETVRALPAGWRIASVGDILKIRNGYAFKSTDYKETGVPLIRQSELKSDVIDLSEAKRVDPGFLEELSGFIVREGDLLIGMSGSLGKIAEYQNKEPALQNQRTGLLIMKPGYDAKFARLVLKLVEPQILAEGKGVAVQNVSAKEIEACTFLLPPANDQRRIVAEIEQQFTRLDAGVAALRRTQANLKRYRAAVLKAACEGRLVPTEAELARQRDLEGSTPTGDFDSPSHGSNPQSRRRTSISRQGSGEQGVVSSGLTSPTSYETGEALLARILTERRKNWQGRGKYKEPEAPDAANESALISGWVWTNIGQVAEVGTGATPNRGKKEYYTGGKIPWVTSGCVNSPRVDEADQFVTSAALDQCNLTIYPPGTLILAMYGEGKTRGMAAELGLPATTNQALAAIQTPETIRAFIKVVLWKTYEDIRKSASGGVQPNLNLSIVRAIPVPLPPLAEQTRIVAEVERRLSVVDELESVVKANLQRAACLRQSILHEAFSINKHI